MRSAVAGMLAAITLALPSQGAQAPADRISRPGRYAGYSPVLYDGVQRSSEYLTVRDGTRLAIDVFRPTRNGMAVDSRLPVVWMNTPYDRRVTDGEETVRFYPGAALALVRYGYVVAVADMRGTGASFGRAVHANRNEWMPWAYWDAYDVTEWLARQPWSDGMIGMWGCSATGHSQWQAAATRPPHLKAIFPMSAPSEYYNWGGIISADPWPDQPWPGPVPAADATAAPVDADRDGALLRAAKDEHRYNLDYGAMPFRDSVSPAMAAKLGIGNYRYWLEASTFTHFADINRAGIPAYQAASFGEDMRVKLGVFVKQRNVTAPTKLVLGPDRHCTWSSDYRQSTINRFRIDTEELRWFDHWLKGVANGIAGEPPIYYYTYNLPEDRAWHHAWQWPLPTEGSARYYLAAGPGGSRAGGLSPRPATGSGGADAYTVDYGVTPATRNERGMTYTSAPLATDLTMTGHPVLHLWITSTATDGDFLAALADVGPDGRATMLPGTDDGQLRASHRRLGRAPYDNLGLPYHRSYAADAEPLVPGRPAELTFDLAPISWVFRAGHSLRLVLWGVGASHKGEPPVTPVLSPPPTVRFLRDAAHPSYISMPASTPVRATAQVARSGGRATATLSFPPSLDVRYIRDVDPASVTLDGIRASDVAVRGRRIVARFTGTPIHRGTIRGRFGKTYDYGPLTTFISSGR